MSGKIIKRIFLGTTIFLILAATLLYFVIFTDLLESEEIFIYEIFREKPQNLEVTYTNPICDGGPLFDPFIKDKTWDNDGNLSVVAVIPANCGDYHWFGDYQNINGKLTLYYGELSREFSTCGACPVTIKYKIRKLPQYPSEIDITHKE